MTLLYIIYQTPTELFPVNMAAIDIEMLKQIKRYTEKENDLIARWKIFKKVTNRSNINVSKEKKLA